MSFLTKYQAIAVSAAMMLTTAALPAHAALERVGPTSSAPSVGGFPSWYQDFTGLALEFCDPNSAEVLGGWCLLLPADVPVAPEVFPTNFFDEHFYFRAGAGPLTTSNGGKVSLNLALEGAFATGPAIPGDQITFARIRVSLTSVPKTGTYRFIHPYGEERVDGVAGGRIFFTQDIGPTCARGTFDCALNSRLGPFLLSSLTPGGVELPPVTFAGSGKSYIADPARVGPVTGSPLPAFIDSAGASRNHNIFRIEGPAGSNLGVGVDFIETTNFSLMGRVFSGAMPGTVTVEGAHYAQNPADGVKLDVFATAFPASQGRLPAQPTPAPVAPVLSFFNAPCAGTVDPLTGAVLPPFSAPAGAVETTMVVDNERHWGQLRPALIPSAVCVKDSSTLDAAGIAVPTFLQQTVTDEVTIGQALYDNGLGTLTVTASSSDVNVTAPPTLTLTYGTVRSNLVNGQVTVPAVLAPPYKVRVFSSALGMSEYQVSTNLAVAAQPIPPTATADSFTFLEDSGPQNLVVLSNDSNVAGGIVTLTSLPTRGTAVVNPGGSVTYTSNLNANGTDSFTYLVTVGGQGASAIVSLIITPVNDAPVAVADPIFRAIVNQPIQLNVLANDSDPDGDALSAVLVTPPAAGATMTATAGGFTFNATAAATYTFTYQAKDASLASNTVTDTVTVTAAETLAITRAEYVVSKSSLRVQGTFTSTINPNQTITVVFVDAAGNTLGTAGSTGAAAGSWALNTTVAKPAGTTAVKATSVNGTAASLALTLK